MVITGYRVSYLGRIKHPFEKRIVSKRLLDARYGGGNVCSGNRKDLDRHDESTRNYYYNLINYNFYWLCGWAATTKWCMRGNGGGGG